MDADDRARRDYANLVASLVHDLRNPLAALAGNLELLREELGDVALPAGALACMSDADALVARVLALVGNIVDADALGRGTVVARRAPTALAAEVERVQTLFAAEIAARRLAVELAVPPELTAEVDPRLFGRVLQSLFDNAVRYAPRDGRIAVRAARDGGEVSIAVGNSGPPLSEAERLQVFAPEFRAAERVHAARRGRGLGMYFCRLVAEAHGGTIAVVVGGALPVEFVLRLPAG